MASNAEPNIAPDGGSDPPPASEAVVSQTRYDLRPRQKLNEISGSGVEQDPLETSEPGRRAGATVFIHGVDAMISPPHDGDANEPRQPRDWRAPHEPRKNGGRPAVLVTLVPGFPAPTALPLAEESFHNPSLAPPRSLLERLSKPSIEVCVTPPQTMSPRRLATRYAEAQGARRRTPRSW